MKFARSFLAIVLLLVAARVAAQSMTPQNTVIESEQLDMRSTDTETIIVLTGKVVVTSTNQRLTCDRLEVVAIREGDPKDTIGKIEAYKSLVATGNVKIVQGDREAACGKAEIKPAQREVELTGQPVVVDHTANITFTGEILRLLAGERQVFGTNVRIVGPALPDLGVDKNKLLPPGTPSAGQEAPKKS